MAKVNNPSPSSSFPLYEKLALKYNTHRVLDIVVAFLLASLLVCRLLHLHHHGFAWLIALSCESWFAFLWLLTVSTKWTPADFKTYPERLSKRVEERELPAVDMFVTTADPVLEPPIITVNTVLSLLAVDYPASKLACYVSDDGCSPLTYYSLVEASKFATLWVPFCKKYNVQLRAPFRYFSGAGDDSSGDDKSSEFRQEHDKMKEEYGKLCRKIEEAAAGKQPSSLTNSGVDLAVFENVERRNHPTIIKVISENKYDESEEEEAGVPHLVYISREKRPKHPHHYKAGAMNVLTRVSGVMTNAPYMLNVDCDMYANNPLIVRHAMCVLLDTTGRETGFAQFPQSFYGALKDDPFGNQMVVLYQFVGAGISGIQGPFYGGTGCFHRRKVIYGLCPNDIGEQARILSSVHEDLSEKELVKVYGASMEFAESAAITLKGLSNVVTTSKGSLVDLVEAANQVAGCGYESASKWGKAYVGWQYGSTTEDVLTGLTIHARGWTSVMCNPYPIAFMGCAPTGGPASLTQQKRWATGLLEILIAGRRSPLVLVFTAKLRFRQCLGYLWIMTWALRSIPELCYSLLPAYCLITHSNFLPKVQDPEFYITLAPLAAYTVYTLLEYYQTGLSIRAWWNNMRMARIVATGPRLFSVLSVICKVLGLSETVFEVTQKDSADDDQSQHDDEASRFTFDGSPTFVPGTTILLVNLAALGIGLVMMGLRDIGPGLGEVMGCVVVLGFFWPFVEGLFVGRGKYGIPRATVGTSFALALVFVISLITRPSYGRLGLQNV